MNPSDLITSKSASDPLAPCFRSAKKGPPIAPPLNPVTGEPVQVQYLASEIRAICARRGRILFPLRCTGNYKNGYRAPWQRKGWKTTVHPTEMLLAWVERGGWLGVLPASLGLWCADVDEGGMEAVHALQQELGPALAISPTRQGYHVWFSLADGEVVTNGDWQCGPGRGQLRGSNGYAVVWHSRTLLNALKGAVHAAPVSPVPILATKSKPAARRNSNGEARIRPRSPPSARLQDAARFLDRERMGDTVAYDTWIRFGLGIHHQTGGSDEGFALWDEWSRGFDNYPGEGEPTTGEKWASFNGSADDPVTANSIFNLARDRGWKGGRANGAAHKGNGLDTSLLAGSGTGVGAGSLRTLSEGAFCRRWEEEHSRDEYLFASGEGWLVFVAGRWEPGECAARKSMSGNIKGIVEGTEEARRFDCHRVVRGALSMAEYERTVPVDSFDSKGHLVPFPDGRVLDLQSWQQRPARPEDRIRKTLAVSPESKPSQRWCEFLDQALSHYHKKQRAEIAAYIQEWCGLALTGDCRDEAALFLWGDSGCGKSTFFETLLAVLGNLGTTVSGKRVAGDREDHRQWLARLQGRRLVVVNELPERGRWNTEDMNALIDGGPIEANRMRQDSIEFKSQAHVLITGNHRPNAAAASGIWRRLKQIEFRHKPQVPDVGLKEQLRCELPGVLRWCLQGLHRWRERGRLPDVPGAVSEGVERYRAAADPIARFVKECTVPDSIGTVEVAALYSAFSNWWLAEVGDHVPSKKALGAALDDLGWAPSVVAKGKRHRAGHRLRAT